MSDEELTPQEIDAIETVILSGVAGDFGDVADAVQERYGLFVGASKVERVYRAMAEAQREAGAERARGGHQPQPSGADSGEETLQKVLRFAQEMGGFQQARAALDAVERRLRDLI